MNSFPSTVLHDKTDIKIFILYLMENLTVPLRYSELTEIAVADGVVSCIDFAECFAELLDCDCVRPCGEEGSENAGGAEKGSAASEGAPAPERFFEITPRGRSAAATLQSKLIHYIRDRSLRSALRRLQFSREGGGIRTEKSRRADGRYDVTCLALDGKGNETLRVSLIAEDDARAEQMRDSFNDRPEHIYRAIVALLTGEATFLE